MSFLEELLLDPTEVRRRLRELAKVPLNELIVSDQLPPHMPQEALVPAGVLFPLTEIEGQMHALFTKRPETLRHHSGEVSFPGGRAELSDQSLVETALREAKEEVSLAEEDVEIYGPLLQLPMISGFKVTTFVGEFPQPYEIVADPDEVEVFFTVPLVDLADPKRRRVEKRRFQGVNFTVHYFDHQGHTIWGATGYMVHVLLEFLRGESR